MEILSERRLRTERGAHHDVRAGQVGAAEVVPAVGGGGELVFEEVELGLEVRVQVFRFDGPGDHEGEGADEEGGGGLDV